MTVRELIDWLEEIAEENENKRVVISGENGGGYVENINGEVELLPMQKFNGGEEIVVVLKSEQIGMV